MAGNVWEWCLNKFVDAKDMSIGGEGLRVVRGGCWVNLDNLCRAACRDARDPYFRLDHVGFRLCLSSPIVDG